MARKVGKLGEIVEFLKELDINISDIESSDAFIIELLADAKTVHDPRHFLYIRHLLEDILIICLLAILADCDEWGEIAEFAREKE